MHVLSVVTGHGCKCQACAVGLFAASKRCANPLYTSAEDISSVPFPSALQLCRLGSRATSLSSAQRRPIPQECMVDFGSSRLAPARLGPTQVGTEVLSFRLGYLHVDEVNHTSTTSIGQAGLKQTQIRGPLQGTVDYRCPEWKLVYGINIYRHIYMYIYI